MIQTEKAIYERYITPTKKTRPHVIGVEIEMPVVSLHQKPVETDDVLQAAEAFRKQFGFLAIHQDDDGNVNFMEDPKTGDSLSFDCSYSNLELSFGKAVTLSEIENRFRDYYQYLQNQLTETGNTLTGMGINPAWDINYNSPVPNERYRMLYHYLHSYHEHEPEVDFRFHHSPAFGTFTSASQVQIDVDYPDLLDTVNIFGLLEPYKVLLFANSYHPDYPEYTCSRNMLWEHSMQGYNPHNVGMFEISLHSVQELMDYIQSASMYCTMRDGKYINFTPIPVNQYFQMESITGEYFDGESYQPVVFSPMVEDLQYLRTFKFEDLTFRGTIEYRSACCQPIRDVMTVAAFHVGLLNQLPVLKKLLQEDTVIYTHGYHAAELQRMLSRRQLPAFLDQKACIHQLLCILELAETGLQRRGYGEEKLIAPLFTRAEQLTNPARVMLQGLEQGKDLMHFVQDYAILS